MGKHEIRLRRSMMTSRRIERHKNYSGIMEQHKRTQRIRGIVKWIVYVLLFLIGLMVVFYTVDKKGKFNKDTTKELPLDSNKE